jgi:hypothetical protein
MTVAEIFDSPALAEAAREIAAADIATFVESQLAYHSIGTMTEEERRRFILSLCASLRIVPIGTELPIDIIQVENDFGAPVEKLYFRKGAADQLAVNHNVSFSTVQRPSEAIVHGVHVIVASERASLPTGRGLDEEGVVPTPIQQRGMSDEQYVLSVANAMMHAKTKARRRAVLALLGLGFVDESELHSMRVRRPVPANSPAPANSQTAVVANDANDSHVANPESSEAHAGEPQREYTPLDRLADELDGFGIPIALEQGIGVLLDHEREIPVEDHGRASDMVRDRLPVPMSPSAFSRAVAVAKQCEKAPLLRTIRNALAKPATADELVKVWRALAPEIATLDLYTRQLAEKDALFEAVRRIDPNAAHPNVWMKHAAASLEARGGVEPPATTTDAGVAPGGTSAPIAATQPPQPAGPITKIPRRAPRV